jgi:hypothetical protein
MRFSSSPTYLAPLISLRTILASPVSHFDSIAAPQVVVEGPFPIDYSISTSQHPIGKDDDTVHILASCYSGGDINTGDIEALFKYLQSRGGDFYLPKSSALQTTLGSARACTYNNYLFENTHVSYWEAGWGVRSVKEACCFTPYCGGGESSHVNFCSNAMQKEWSICIGKDAFTD